MPTDQTSDDSDESHNAGEGAGGSGTLLPFLVICAAYFLVILDTMVVNSALPSISRSLLASPSELTWVVDAFNLAFATLLLTAGSLADTYGAKTLFQTGVGIFVFSTLACGLASSIGMLIIARVGEGIGGALAVPASLALLGNVYQDPRKRRLAFGTWGAIAGIAAAAGPVIGGALVSEFGWRSVFFVGVPIGLIALVLGIWVLPSTTRIRRRLDIPGQLAGAVCLGALAFALIETSTHAWDSPLVVGGIAIGCASGGAFIAIEERVRVPMVPLGLFRRASFAGPNAIGLLINLGFYGEIFVLNLYLQERRGLSPLGAGIALLPELAMAVIGSVLSGRMMARTGPRAPILLGLILGSLGFIGLALLLGENNTWALLGPLVAIGLGMSLVMPAATAAVMEGVSPASGGLASGILNAARQTGGVIGVALLGALVAPKAPSIAGLDVAMLIAAGAFALGALIAAPAIGSRR